MKYHRNHPRGGEARRFGNVVMIAFLLLSLFFLSILKSFFLSPPLGKSEGNRFETEEKQRLEAVSTVTQSAVTEPKQKLEMVTDQTAESAATEEEDQGEARRRGEETEASTAEEQAPPEEMSVTKPVCFSSGKRSETCDAAGDVRVQGRTQTIFVHPMSKEHRIKPYARKHDPPAMSHVSEWTLKPFSLSGDRPPPQCTKNYSVPAFLFSNGGFTGNLFHDYTDVLVPVFISTYQFKGDVQFLVSGLKPWWVGKFSQILKQLTNLEIVAADTDPEVRCYPRVVAGPTFHKELGVDPARTPGGYSVLEFKRLLREAFGLERAVAGARPGRPPRLLIISRKNSRRFLNEREIAETAEGAGFDVRVAEPDMNTTVASFARLVNSADVMIGVHGAGLTNMVFLPEGAVLIQVVPFGGLEWVTRITFKEPSEDQGIKYMDYNVKLEESSLKDQYPKDHPVVKDPYSIHRQGWDAMKTVYLDKQDVRPNLERLKGTLLEALRLLPQHSHSR